MFAMALTEDSRHLCASPLYHRNEPCWCLIYTARLALTRCLPRRHRHTMVKCCRLKRLSPFRSKHWDIKIDSHAKSKKHLDKHRSKHFHHHVCTVFTESCCACRRLRLLFEAHARVGGVEGACALVTFVLLNPCSIPQKTSPPLFNETCNKCTSHVV